MEVKISNRTAQAYKYFIEHHPSFFINKKYIGYYGQGLKNRCKVCGCEQEFCENILHQTSCIEVYPLLPLQEIMEAISEIASVEEKCCQRRKEYWFKMKHYYKMEEDRHNK